MAKVLLLQQSTRKQLKEMKSIINPSRYSTLKEKILGAKRVSTLQNVQAKLSKIHSDNARGVCLIQTRAVGLTPTVWLRADGQAEIWQNTGQHQPLENIEEPAQAL